MKITIDKKAQTATIVLDLLPELRMSSTGNTETMAEARNQGTGLKAEDGREIKVSCQVYLKVPKAG